MARFFMLLNSTSQPGRAGEYSEWCRARHMPDLMDIPGVVAIRRFRELGGADTEGQVRFSTLFELECEHPRDVMAEIGRRMATKEMDRSDSYDPASVSNMFVELEGEWGNMS